MLREWTPLLERIAAASFMVIVLVVVARLSSPGSTLASHKPTGIATTPPPAAKPNRPAGFSPDEAETALVGELVGAEHIIRIYAGDPLRYTVLDRSGRVLCRLERAEVVIERFPEIQLRDLLTTQAPALMRVDPSASDIRY